MSKAQTYVTVNAYLSGWGLPPRLAKTARSAAQSGALRGLGVVVDPERGVVYVRSDIEPSTIFGALARDPSLAAMPVDISISAMNTAATIASPTPGVDDAPPDSATTTPRRQPQPPRAVAETETDEIDCAGPPDSASPTPWLATATTKR